MGVWGEGGREVTASIARAARAASVARAAAETLPLLPAGAPSQPVTSDIRDGRPDIG